MTMRREDRKAAIGAYKERKSVAGIYALRCVATGEIWVSQASNVQTVQNRIWFTLKQGNSPRQGLQKAWRDHGEENLTFEVLETLADEESPFVRNALLMERMTHWRSALNAQAI
jgi:hypothetical protein